MRTMWCGISLILCLAAAAEAMPKVPPLTGADMRGGGSWKADRVDHSRQKWHLQVKRDGDDSVRGRIRIEGSPLVSDGNVEGRINGDAIVGTITGDDGTAVATFQGTLTSNGMFGTYTAADGEVGEWSWGGKLEP